MLQLQRSQGNQAVQRLVRSGVSQAKRGGNVPGDRYEQEADRVAEQVIRMPEPAVQRTCACGNHTMAGGECSECSKKQRLGLQTKLKVNEPGDIYEQEADRIADQVMAMSAHSGVGGPPLRIQRSSGHSNRQTETAPASVDQTLANPGKPLEPALRQDMEQRFGHDFSRVRVHTDSLAARSAKEVAADAYTVGRHIVFGAGQYAPHILAGRRLLTHELTHVVQQGPASGVPPSHAGTGPQIASTSLSIQRQHAQGMHPTSPVIPSVPSEKWRADIEAQYRRAGFSEAANAVAQCREWGICGNILTLGEAWDAYRTGRIRANLGEPTERAPTRGEPGNNVAVAGVVAPAAVGSSGLAVAESTAARTALERAAARWGTAAVLEGGATTGAATGTAGAATVAVPVAVGVVIVLGIIDLISWGNFQVKLEKLGYTILPDPLGTCIGNCHRAPEPTYRPRFPTFPSQPLTPLRPSPFGPTISPEEMEKIKEWLDKTAPQGEPKPTPTTVSPPVPAPEPSRERRRRRGSCEELPISWPTELPNPYEAFGGPVELIRVRSSERDLETLGPRGSAQRNLSNQIRDAREALVPPPQACFPNPDPFEYYDAHHIHPLFLAGIDQDENLCALETRRHHRGHRRLQHQPEWLNYYILCGETTDDLYKHSSYNEYVIIGDK